MRLQPVLVLCILLLLPAAALVAVADTPTVPPDTTVTPTWKAPTPRPTVNPWDVYYRPKQEVVATIAPIDTTPFDTLLEASLPEDWSLISIQNVISGVVGPYTGPMGGLVWLAIFGIAAGMIYLYTDSTLIPGILLMSGGGLFMGVVPDPFRLACYAFLAIGLAGSLYALVNKR